MCPIIPSERISTVTELHGRTELDTLLFSCTESTNSSLHFFLNSRVAALLMWGNNANDASGRINTGNVDINLPISASA